MKFRKMILSVLLLVSLGTPAVMSSATTVNADYEEPGSTVYVLGVVHVADIVTQGNFVPMVSFNADNSVSPVTNRALQNDTPWRSDIQKRATDGGWYYRVSTNEWVNSEYVPSYELINA
ncbi:hypothetical protein [Companilactobacillus keshanensis]|uniref:Surface layer protein A domain-containing protein n=1 Tax=Companilactobacillus keshanensis TaxID=2486003 RepID=A0ABW4BSA9_9LACO|nr:hypothetical protein [Companilactobacillus keshanensis]